MFGWLRQGPARERKSGNGYEILTGGALPTAAGVSVSPETAMRCSAAFACVKVIAETAEQIPWYLYRRKGEDDRERAAGPADAVNDVVQAGACRVSLTTRLPLMLREHKGAPIGQWIEATEDDVGLKVRGVVTDLITLGDLRAGRLDGLSIGYVSPPRRTGDDASAGYLARPGLLPRIGTTCRKSPLTGGTARRSLPPCSGRTSPWRRPARGLPV